MGQFHMPRLWMCSCLFCALMCQSFTQISLKPAVPAPSLAPCTLGTCSSPSLMLVTAAFPPCFCDYTFIYSQHLAQYLANSMPQEQEGSTWFVLHPTLIRESLKLTWKSLSFFIRISVHLSVKSWELWVSHSGTICMHRSSGALLLSIPTCGYWFTGWALAQLSSGFSLHFWPFMSSLVMWCYIILM